MQTYTVYLNGKYGSTQRFHNKAKTTVTVEAASKAEALAKAIQTDAKMAQYIARKYDDLTTADDFFCEPTGKHDAIVWKYYRHPIANPFINGTPEEIEPEYANYPVLDEDTPKRVVQPLNDEKVRRDFTDFELCVLDEYAERYLKFRPLYTKEYYLSQLEDKPQLFSLADLTILAHEWLKRDGAFMVKTN